MNETYPPTPGNPAQPPLESTVTPPDLANGLVCPTIEPQRSASTIAVEHNLATPHRRRRGADPSRDNVWSRNHAICLAGAACDCMLDGYDAARTAVAPLMTSIYPREVAVTLIFTCPWLLKPGYLNLEGTAALLASGIGSCAQSWLSNRIYYFYYDPEHSEHPYFRRKNNLHAVYKDFYDCFIDNLRNGTGIRERDAEAFWLCVADRVPFLRPLAPVVHEQVAQLPIQKEVAYVG